MIPCQWISLIEHGVILIPVKREAAFIKKTNVLFNISICRKKVFTV